MKLGFRIKKIKKFLRLKMKKNKVFKFLKKGYGKFLKFMKGNRVLTRELKKDIF
jgi:hypothetical protein